MESTKFLLFVSILVFFGLIISLFKNLYKEIKKYKSFDVTNVNAKIYYERQQCKEKIIAMTIGFIVLCVFFICSVIYFPEIISGTYDKNYMVEKCEITNFIEKTKGAYNEMSCHSDNFDITNDSFVNESGDKLYYDDIGKFACIKYYPDGPIIEIMRIGDNENLTCDDFYWSGHTSNDKTNYNYSVIKCDVKKNNNGIINCEFEGTVKINNVKLLNEKDIKEKSHVCLKYYWDNNTGKILYVNDTNKNFNCDRYLKTEEEKDKKE